MPHLGRFTNRHDTQGMFSWAQTNYLADLIVVKGAYENGAQIK